MSTYFVYRSHYDSPMGKHLRRFDDATVLDWFRRNWVGIDRDAAPWEYVEKLLGCDVYGFHSLFEAIAEHGLKAPRTSGQLQGYLEEHLHVEGEVLYEPHVVQVLTDDDELQMACYFFDDQFLARHGDRAAYLLQADWRLPTETGEARFRPAVRTTALAPGGGGEGATYLAFVAFYDSGNLYDMEGGYRIPGVRLPELAPYLARVTPGDWPRELLLLRSQLFTGMKGNTADEKAFLKALQQRPDDEATWQVYSDWLEERGRPHAGPLLLEGALRAVSRLPVTDLTGGMGLVRVGRADVESARRGVQGLVKEHGRKGYQPSRSLLHVDGHAATLCVHVAVWRLPKHHLYQQWLLFDDLWASAHADLANAILRHVRRWDVLS